MPAALLENTPQDDFGLNLANRKCSERRDVSRLLHQRSGTAKGKRKASARSGTESRERQCGVVVTEPPGGKQRSQDRSRPPDGTGRRQGGRAMKAGSFGNHRDADPERLWAAMPTDAYGEADGTRRSPKIDRAHAGDLGAGGNAGPICVWGLTWGSGSECHWAANVRFSTC